MRIWAWVHERRKDFVCVFVYVQECVLKLYGGAEGFQALAHEYLSM